VEIREAGAADWAQVWPVFHQVMKAQETYAFDPEMTEDVARSIWMERPPGSTVVAVDAAGGALLGSAKMGPNRGGPGAHVGTASFLVDETARGRGVGRALGEYVVDWHRRQGFRAITFNAVVETNTAAVDLWRSLGFEIVGTVPESFSHPVHGFVGLHVMHLALQSVGT
jgi:L-amino acid N-acyltransferase YncA